MNTHTSVPLKTRSCLYTLFFITSFICFAYFIATLSLRKHSYMVLLNIEANNDDTQKSSIMKKCNDKCRAVGSEALPKGIVSTTTNLEMIPLSGPILEDNDSRDKTRQSLLAIPVGIKQKGLVNKLVKKFLGDGFVVMLFHYDGLVNQWNDLEWSESVIHISATNQTKWWFAKRFLHPDVVDDYEYIFLWDEDLGVENFLPKRYISIIKEEGLEISQPALDLGRSSKVHHRITVRNRRIKVHRRYYRAGRCDNNSTAPPCVGWVEMMAPVFSRTAWRCVWHMIQNDLIHAWGLDMQLGYCAQGDRSIKVGVVDEQYIAHLALPTLGSYSNKKTTIAEISSQFTPSKNSSNSEPSLVMRTKNSTSSDFNNRSTIRLRSYAEMRTFMNRWNNAVKEDKCWVDPYKPKLN